MNCAELLRYSEIINPTIKKLKTLENEWHNSIPVDAVQLQYSQGC
jgi:hypothetical protein